LRAEVEQEKIDEIGIDLEAESCQNSQQWDIDQVAERKREVKAETKHEIFMAKSVDCNLVPGEASCGNSSLNMTRIRTAIA